MSPTKFKVNFDWSNSEIGWELANSWLLFCTLQVSTNTFFEIPVYKTESDPVTSKYADGNHHSLSDAQLVATTHVTCMHVCTYTLWHGELMLYAPMYVSMYDSSSTPCYVLVNLVTWTLEVKASTYIRTFSWGAKVAIL